MHYEINANSEQNLQENPKNALQTESDITVSEDSEMKINESKNDISYTSVQSEPLYIDTRMPLEGLKIIAKSSKSNHSDNEIDRQEDQDDYEDSEMVVQQIDWVEELKQFEL